MRASIFQSPSSPSQLQKSSFSVNFFIFLHLSHKYISPVEIKLWSWNSARRFGSGSKCVFSRFQVFILIPVPLLLSCTLPKIIPKEEFLYSVNILSSQLEAIFKFSMPQNTKIQGDWKKIHVIKRSENEIFGKMISSKTTFFWRYIKSFSYSTIFYKNLIRFWLWSGGGRGKRLRYWTFPPPLCTAMSRRKKHSTINRQFTWKIWLKKQRITMHFLFIFFYSFRIRG